MHLIICFVMWVICIIALYIAAEKSKKESWPQTDFSTPPWTMVLGVLCWITCGLTLIILCLVMRKQ